MAICTNLLFLKLLISFTELATGLYCQINFILNCAQNISDVTSSSDSDVDRYVIPRNSSIVVCVYSLPR
jgi:hypothetical protein